MSINDHRLARLLDAPFLARIVPQLPPETLHQLIQYRGLDACGELVAAATPAQLTSLLDLDLWRNERPGRDEQFDVDRFGEWIEVLVDTGESVAARAVAVLDAGLIIAGLSRYLRVFDPGIFEPTAQSDDESIDRHEAMREGDRHAPMREPNDDGLECEVGGYLVRARRADTWDAIVALLIALESEHHDCFDAVMQGCRRLSNSRPEVDGLDDLLRAPEQHLHDVEVERSRRRSRQGYATPADARAFLQMARHTRPASGTWASTNPIATAYARDEHDIQPSVDAVIDLLAEAGRPRQGDAVQRLPPERPRALPGAADQGQPAGRLPRLRQLMAAVLHHDETAYLARNRELAFLANTLHAGSSLQSRSFTPREASDAAASVCNLGLECCDPEILTDTFLVERDLVAVFERGWSVLYEDVSVFVADQLISILADLRCADADTDRGLRALRRTLVKQREAGTPWLGRDEADVLATLDPAAWISVLGLLDECPVLSETLTAVLERRTTPVSPTAFTFISTTAQIGDVRVFMRTLPSVLSV